MATAWCTVSVNGQSTERDRPGFELPLLGSVAGFERPTVRLVRTGAGPGEFPR
jgi:hypothetical protein